MNKIWKYKPGDKVIILKDHYVFEKGHIGKVVSIKDNTNSYLVNLSNDTSTFDVLFPNFCLKYYYEEPLQDLFKRITANCPPIMKDYLIIGPLIDSDKTLTNKELIICQNLWEKYNKL